MGTLEDILYEKVDICVYVNDDLHHLLTLASAGHTHAYERFYNVRMKYLRVH